MPCRRRLSTLLKAKSGREGRGWCQLRQLEEELCQLSRPTGQVAEVFHFVEAEDSRRRMLCPWRAHPLASTLPAVARATAGRFMRCEWLVGHVACVLRDPSSCLCVGRSPRRVSLEIGAPRASTLPVGLLGIFPSSFFMGAIQALEPPRHRHVLRQLATDSAKISSATSRGCPPSTPPQIVTRSCTPSLHALRQRGRACMRTHHC